MSVATTAVPTIGAMVRIPKDLLDDGDIEQIRHDLTFRYEGDSRFGFGSAGRCLMLYDDSGQWMTVPRAYGLGLLRNMRSLAGSRPVDLMSPGSQVQFEFNEELQNSRPELKAIQDRLVAQVVRKMNSGIIGGILCASCGSGKTVTACKIAAQLGVTVLVVVHKEFLVDQWRDRITTWLGIPADEIGIVQQDRCDYHGKKIVIAMLQSLVERDYDPGLYAWPGLVCLDEVHRQAADLWHKAVMRFSSRYRLGLTATPSRKDGMWDVVRANVGEILAQDTSEVMVPTVYAVRHRPNISPRRYCWLYPGSDGFTRVKKVYLAKLLTLLARDEGRNKMLVQIILKAARESRKVLLLTDRLEHISTLKSMLVAADPTLAVGRYVGGMSAEARAISEKCQVILGTFQMAMEALDIPSLDVGILATPHSDVVQSTGRICRMMDGKKQPVLIDVVDDEPHICRSFFAKRRRFYDSRNWPIKYLG